MKEKQVLSFVDIGRGLESDIVLVGYESLTAVINLPEYNVAESQLTFRGNISPPSSESKNKPCSKPA
jgi:hypothetical protein